MFSFCFPLQKHVDYESFSKLVENFKRTLRHTDPMVLDDFGTSLPFIDIYLSTLDKQDTTVYKSVPALLTPAQETRLFLVPRRL